ncbi:hypothetical protein RhiJN_10743 [Ceratobasidium sp. AG-Ba]|nr:hypothetical protein RhiJN_10743 [Ceratobasidium sp. AG-Ba]QRW11471.1 hypothetical protein RhiLY_10470 [Ceratobasidium sp. AG-Ba]
MPVNFTVDDYSPLIEYQGQRFDSFNISLALDPFGNLYRDKSFHSSHTNGSAATISFKGTAIYIFGAKRGNHGYYHVSVDGDPGRQFDGYAPQQPDGVDGVYQIPLFARNGMADGEHTVTLTNIVNGNRPFVDIDYIVWTQKGDVSFDSKIVEDGGFQYSTPTSSWNDNNNVSGYRSQTSHSTTILNAAASLAFQGSEIFLYGGTGPNHGEFKVQIDNQQPLVLNGTSPIQHPQTLLYTTSGLGAGQHQLVVTNLGDGQVFDVDYAEIVPANSRDRGLNKGAIAGIVVGIVIGLASITLTVWLFIYRRQKNRRRFSTDLMDDSNNSQPAPMHSYLNGHNPMIVEPFTDAEQPARSSERARTYDNTSKTDIFGQGQRKRTGGPTGSVNRGTNDPGLRPEAATNEAGSSNESRTAIETDAGALPPTYDQVSRAP